MCRNSCVALTGPFMDLDHCPKCGEPKRCPISGKYQQEFHTMPIGPILQALSGRDPQSARWFEYRRSKTREIIDKLLRSNFGNLPTYDDFFHGSEYLENVRNGNITNDDIVLMFSIDGAQLYAHKASDCWIYIWVIMDFSPEEHYKKDFVIPGGFIPGPKKPKNLDSFLFPGLYHLAALQESKGGLNYLECGYWSNIQKSTVSCSQHCRWPSHGISQQPCWPSRHFSHPFLGTYEVHQFLDLGYLEGTHSEVVNELHTNTTVPWNVKPIPYPTHTNTMLHTIPYHTIPYHLTSYHIIRGVWGPCTKYEKYFYRLQYLSVGLHLLWTGSSDFCCHFELQVEAIGWSDPLKTRSIGFYARFWPFPLWIIHHKPLEIVYFARPFD